MEIRLVCSSCPLPQAPCTGVAAAIRVCRIAAVSPLPPPAVPPGTADWATWPAEPFMLPPVTSLSTDAGNTATDSQSFPITWTWLAACRWAADGFCWRADSLGRVTVWTLAPAGGVKLKLAAAGRTNEIAV